MADIMQPQQDIKPEGFDDFAQTSSPSSPIQNPNLDNTQSSNLDAKPEGFDNFAQDALNQEKFSTPMQKGIAALEGVGKGIAGPFSTIAEKAVGIPEENILGREKANPYTEGAGEIGGLAVSSLYGVGEGALAAKLGAKGAEILKLGGQGANLASKIGSAAANSAIQSAIIGGSDDLSRMVLNDPNTSASTAIADVGLNGLLGAGVGAGLGVVSPLFKHISGNASQFIEDFKNAIHNHIVNPDPVSAITEELQNHYTKMNNIADSVYGPQGLKTQDVQKAVPQLNQAIIDQANDLGDKVSSTLSKMQAKPNSYPDRLVSKLSDDYNAYNNALQGSKDSASIFNAMQDMKQQLQAYSKFDKFVKPVDEAYDFVNKSKSLSHDFRTALEDADVWGDAAKRQQAINQAFKEYLPAVQDFEKRFTTKIGGEPQVDIAKVNTYINQLGKPNAEIKQQMLKNYLDASENYKNIINQSHANLDLTPPDMYTPLNVSTSTLGKQTAGQKLANVFVNGLGDAGGKAMGATVGGVAGHAVGSPGFGALLGEHILGPMFGKLLPSLAKPILKLAGNPEGLKSATEYVASVQAGNHIIDRATKSLFKSGQAVLASNLPSDSDKRKLDDKLQEYQINPEGLASIGGSLGNYMPEHATALGQIASNAFNYLSNLRPQTKPISPLDRVPEPSSVAKAKYDNALNIAIKPTSILNKIKSGRLTIDDVAALKNMYPDLYNSMSQKLFNEMTNAINKGKDIPYSVKTAISVFMGQPMDSSMKPEYIQAAQSQNLPAPPAPGPQKAPKGGKQPGSTKSLSKTPNLFQTPNQAAEADNTKR